MSPAARAYLNALKDAIRHAVALGILPILAPCERREQLRDALAPADSRIVRLAARRFIAVWAHSLPTAEVVGIRSITTSQPLAPANFLP